MARQSQNRRDGIYTRGDRAGFWISWSDAQGRRRYRKTDAQNITQARQIRNAELMRVERAKVLGFNPPGKDTFEAVAKRYVKHQKARVSRESCLREEVSIESHLKPFFGGKLSAIRREDIQRFTPERVSVAFRRICRALGIIDFRFHDLRHTAASWLRMSGADIHTVAQLLGHKDLRMACRYQHLSPSFLGEAVGRLDAVFGTVRYQDVTAQKLLSE